MHMYVQLHDRIHDWLQDDDVMNTPLGNRGKAIHKVIFVDILESHAIMHGNINLDTLGDILDVLEVLPKELDHEIQNMSGSPDALTGTNILDASMNLISRSLRARHKRQAMDFREKEQLHQARQLVGDTTRCTNNQQEFTARIQVNKEQLHQS